MELWAAGFNAWGQLDFEAHVDPAGLPEDLIKFKTILKDKRIDVLSTTEAYTSVRTLSKGILLAGESTPIADLHHTSLEQHSLVAVAANDSIAETKNNTIVLYRNLRARAFSNPSSTHTITGSIVQITANQTCFTALSTTGEVYTWGDARYESTLGRPVSLEQPATTPTPISDLSDLPTGQVRKISSGGYVSAALTEGNDLYLWGARVGLFVLIDGLTGEPMPFDLQGEDVLDVAVGFDHILALSTSNRLFVIGAGKNGQLGMGEKVCKGIGEWMEIVLPLKDGQQAVKVWAGYKNSFVLVSDVA